MVASQSGTPPGSFEGVGDGVGRLGRGVGRRRRGRRGLRRGARRRRRPSRRCQCDHQDDDQQRDPQHDQAPDPVDAGRQPRRRLLRTHRPTRSHVSSRTAVRPRRDHGRGPRLDHRPTRGRADGTRRTRTRSEREPHDRPTCARAARPPRTRPRGTSTAVRGTSPTRRRAARRRPPGNPRACARRRRGRARRPRRAARRTRPVRRYRVRTTKQVTDQIPASSRSCRVSAVDIDGLVPMRGNVGRGATDAQPTGSSSMRAITPGLGPVGGHLRDEVRPLLVDGHRAVVRHRPPVELAPAVPLVPRRPQHGLGVRDPGARGRRRTSSIRRDASRRAPTRRRVRPA